MDAEFSTFFPGSAGSSKENAYFSELKTRTSLVLEQITGRDTGDQIEKVEKRLLDQLKPKVFAGKNGEEIRFIRGFEEACILLNQHVPKDPKTMTVLGFYQALEVVKQQHKERQKANKRRG